MKASDLIAFEDEMAALFEAGQIKAPLHLSGGNEDQLIEIFKEIDIENDYVLCSWRSHYHCLLKGVPHEELRQAILDGHSISLSFPEYKVLSSGIVGGIAPIGVGIAAGLKRTQQPGKVWCFVGDMTASTGIVAESLSYAMGHDLPIEFVAENNGLSVCTDTEAAWGPQETVPWKFRSYGYKLTKPHVGIGKHVAF
jgi:TPP-dependent pyruvate/acetoin dehydrogenase alpha subunit